MACSCKKKVNSNQINSTKKSISKAAVRHNILPTERLAFVPLPTKSVVLPNITLAVKEKSDSQYDFSATTRPFQFCLDCICKHLGSAQVLLDQSMPQKLIAVGQIMCAASHLNNRNFNAAQQMRKIAINMIANLQDTKYRYKLQSILDQIQRTKDFPQLEESDIQATPVQVYLAEMLHAYCLIFTQLLYQRLNIPWAVGHISRASLTYIQHTGDRGYFARARQIWKLVQSMGDMDQTYNRAKKQMWSLIQDLYKAFSTQQSDSSQQKS